MSDIDLAAIQRIEYDMLKSFDEICQNHSIPYFLAYGTCLGAVRHNGFIPWDDDIDLYVFESDLPNLREIMQRELPSPLFYQCKETDPEYNLTIDRIRNSNTTAFEREFLDRDVNQGVWMDIQPLYNASPYIAERMWQKCWAMINTLLVVHRAPLNHGHVGRILAKLGLILFDHKYVRKYAKYIISKYSGQDTGVICTFNSCWNMIKRDFPSRMFEPVMQLFCDDEYPIPALFDAYLTSFYGDYMTLPPEGERKGLHTILYFDPNHTYSIHNKEREALKKLFI